MSRRKLSIAIATASLAVSAAFAVAPADASVLCKTRRGALRVRDECKRREETIDTTKIEALGLRGPTGSMGPAGPPGGGLHVVDANGSDVGVVTSLTTYYGQYATVLREITLPGGNGP